VGLFSSSAALSLSSFVNQNFYSYDAVFQESEAPSILLAYKVVILELKAEHFASIREYEAIRGHFLY
jgi:hypothetical protein